MKMVYFIELDHVTFSLYLGEQLYTYRNFRSSHLGFFVFVRKYLVQFRFLVLVCVSFKTFLEISFHFWDVN